MKKSTEDLRKDLLSETVVEHLTSINREAFIGYGDLTIQEGISHFQEAKAKVLASIQNQSFENAAYIRRKNIIDKFKGLSIGRTDTHGFLKKIDEWVDAITLAGIGSTFFEGVNIGELKNQIKFLKRDYSELKRVYDQSQEFIDSIGSIREKAMLHLDEVMHTAENIEKRNIISRENFDKLEINATTSASKLEVIRHAEEDVETKRLSIETFASNIDEYKSNISKLEIMASEVVGREVKIQELIDQAETALQLRSAQGISAAFASQHLEAKNRLVLGAWIVGSAGFLIAALCLTLGLITKTELVDAISGSKSISMIPWLFVIGRAVSVSICLSAAAFCANQFTKQKNLAEDYAYKSVLSKSIVAFTEEIKKRDEQKVAEYLTTVLGEIHKDPLRSRLTKSDGLKTLDIKSIIDAVVDKMSILKKEP